MYVGLVIVIVVWIIQYIPTATLYITKVLSFSTTEPPLRVCDQ